MFRQALSTLVLVLVCAVAPSRAETGPKITSTGSAKVERRPDYVDVTLGIQVQKPTAAAAQAEAESAMKAVVVAVRALKLAGEDLQTGRVDLSPQYDDGRPDGRRPALVGYVATMTLRVRTGDLASSAQIIDAGLTSGANRVDGVSFGIKEALAAREEALTLATRAARSKAAVMAAALDLKVTGVIEATTATKQSWGGFSNFAQNSRSEAAPSGDDDGTVIPGSIEVWAEATVTFSAAELGAPGAK